MIASERSRRAVTLTGRAAAMAGAAQLGAGMAWAAEGGTGGGGPWLDLLWKFINFFVLLGLLWYFARKPLAGMLRSAAEGAKAALDGQRASARKAEAALAEQRTQIETLEAELQRMAAEARQEARVEHDRLLGEARAQAERIRTTVRMQVEQEFSKARKELQAELAQQTVRLAEEQIRGQLDDEGRRRIVTRAIADLEPRP